MMKLHMISAIASASILSACVEQSSPVNPPVSVPVTANAFAKAKEAASICVRHAPNWESVVSGYTNAGFTPPTDRHLKQVDSDGQLQVLTDTATGVVVMIGKNRREGACFVGLEGMTPQQGYALAQPIANKFDAVTNASLGQGLAKNAVEAWRNIGKDKNVYIAAYKSWSVLEEPGSAIRVLYYNK